MRFNSNALLMFSKIETVAIFLTLYRKAFEYCFVIDNEINFLMTLSIHSPHMYKKEAGVKSSSRNAIEMKIIHGTKKQLKAVQH